MGSYMNFIDFRAIQLADLAISIGDNQVALQNYRKAYYRLQKYQGDSMVAIQMGADLARKVKALSNQSGSYSILKFDRWQLTKSSFVQGNQCLKQLWLQKHKRDKKTPPSQETLEKFKAGHKFEDHVREIAFPGGVDIKEKVGNFAYFNSYTNYLINNNGPQTLYESTFIEDGVLVMCDVLVKNSDGLLDIYEIKNSNQLIPVFLEDMALQYAVVKKRFGDKLKSFNAILNDSSDEMNYRIENVTHILEDMQYDVLSKIKHYKKVLHNSEPKVPMGEHCRTPYECQFMDYCKNLK